MNVYYWIRPATNKDLQELIKMEVTEFPPTPIELPWDDKDFKYYIKNPNTFVLVADLGQQIIGKTVGMMYNGSVQRGLQILDLSVRLDWKRWGIGSELLQYVESLGKHLGCTYAALNVKYDNKAAIKMYYKHSYRFIDNNTDELRRMKKEFIC